MAEGFTKAPAFLSESLPKIDQPRLLVDFAPEIGQLQDYKLRISSAHDLLPHLTENFSGAKDVLTDLEAITYVTLESTNSEADPLIHDRKAVLIKTKAGNTAIVAVAKYDQTDLGWYFGGAGNYPIDSTTSPLGHSMEHSEHLAEAMRHKAWEIGVSGHLAGSKTIITTTSWHQDETIQVVAGMMFSPNGVWPDNITGSDVGQNPNTIRNMALGSNMGEGIGQIVGTEHGLPDTASYARHSMEQTYRSMQEHFNLTPLNRTTAIVEGLGKIGSTTTEMLIDNQAIKIFVTDPALFPDLVQSLNLNQSAVDAVSQNWQHLQQLANEKGVELVLIRPEELESQQANLYCPSSSKEGIIDKTRIDLMAQNGHLKVILSGANNAFADNQLATYAEKTYGILTPPPGLANGGSATSAAFEPRFLFERSQGKWQDEPNNPGYRQFVKQVLVPHISNNAREKMTILTRIWKQQKNQGVSLFSAGNIAFEQWRKGQN